MMKTSYTFALCTGAFLSNKKIFDTNIISEIAKHKQVKW